MSVCAGKEGIEASLVKKYASYSKKVNNNIENSREINCLLCTYMYLYLCTSIAQDIKLQSQVVDYFCHLKISQLFSKWPFRMSNLDDAFILVARNKVLYATTLTLWSRIFQNYDLVTVSGLLFLFKLFFTKKSRIWLAESSNFVVSVIWKFWTYT